MSQPVDMTLEQLHERIASGAVGPRALISRDGSAPIEWPRHPDFAELSASMGLRASGAQAAVNGTNRVDSLRKVREKRMTLSGSQPSVGSPSPDEPIAVSGATFQTRSYAPSQALREASNNLWSQGWREPDTIPVNNQWRGLALTKTYEALLDVPVLEVFGLPWNAPRNAVNMALLNLTSEIDKEAPKEETQLDARIREKIIEVLAACHSAYTLPAHNLVAMRIQHRFERVPFVSEILPYYTENVVGSLGRQTKASSSSDSSTKSKGASARSTSSPSSKAKGKDDGTKAAASGNTTTFAIIGAVLIALAAGYNVVDCGGGGGGGAGPSGGIGPDGQPIP